MNSNKSEIYVLTRFQLHMYEVKIPEQFHAYIFPVLIRESQQQIRES